MVKVKLINGEFFVQFGLTITKCNTILPAGLDFQVEQMRDGL